MTELEIIEKYSEMVRVLAVARTNQESDADDVYQEVFCSYITHHPKFRNEDHAKAWFIKVTLNITKNMYKAFDVSKRADMDESTIEAVISDKDFMAEVESNTDFEECIKKISPNHKAILLLYFDCGYTIKEIAKMMDMTESNVKAHLTRGKREYRQLVLEGDDKND